MLKNSGKPVASVSSPDPVKVLRDTRRSLIKLVANIDDVLRASDDRQGHEEDRNRATG